MTEVSSHAFQYKKSVFKNTRRKTASTKTNALYPVCHLGAPKPYIILTQRV